MSRPSLSGAERIAAERARQITIEHYGPEDDDDERGDGSLALVAALYATPIPLMRMAKQFGSFIFDDPFPWDSMYDRRGDHGKQSRKDRIRQLEKAGALIAAEIDRLVRAGAPRKKS